MIESNFKFSIPRLTHIEFKIKDNNMVKGTSTYRNKFNISVINEDYENRNATVELKFSPECIEGEPPFDLNIVMMCNFSWSEEYDKDTITDLLMINAPSLLLSYMRPIVANITSNGMGTAYNIPFIDFTK